MKNNVLILLSVTLLLVFPLSVRAEGGGETDTETTVGINGYVYVTPKPPEPDGDTGSNTENGGASQSRPTRPYRPSGFSRPPAGSILVSYPSAPSRYEHIGPTPNPQTGDFDNTVCLAVFLFATSVMLAVRLFLRKRAVPIQKETKQ